MENSHWISVTEKLPENKKDVLTINTKKQEVAFYTKGHEVEYEDYDYVDECDDVEEKNGTLYLKPGWYQLVETPGGEYDYTYVVRSVKYWQNLPQPPEKQVVHTPEEKDVWDNKMDN